VTVSDGKRLKPHSLTDSERAKWAAEAWYLNERQNMSSRSIAKKWADEQGFHVSHVTIIKWINEAREQAQVLDLFGPAQVRAGQLGRLENYLEQLLAAVQNQEIDTDVGFKLIHQYEALLTKISGSAAPVKSQVEVTTTDRAHPDMALLEELRRVTQHEKHMEEREANDGLMD
jgi:transposase